MKALLEGGPHAGRKLHLEEDVHALISMSGFQQPHELWEGKPDRVMVFDDITAEGHARYVLKPAQAAAHKAQPKEEV